MKKLGLIAIIIVSLFAAPALQREFDFKQEDGTTFKGHLKGDEWFNWVETGEGYVAKYNKQSKNYEYMILKKESNKSALEFSNIKVSGKSANGAAQAQQNLPEQIKKIPSKDLGAIWKEKRKKMIPASR